MRPPPVATLLAMALALTAVPIGARAADPDPDTGTGTGTGTGTNGGDTRLELGATGTVDAAPDLLAATLSASAGGADPAAVQRRVDGLLADAAREARGVPGLAVRSAGYDTGQDDKGRWTATGRLALRSGDAASLLGLVGRLQAHGLTLDGLGWELSPAARARAEDAASRGALTALRARAADAAATLGLHVARIASVRLSTEARFGPRPMMASMAMRRQVAPPAPAGTEPVEVTASATVLLRP